MAHRAGSVRGVSPEAHTTGKRVVCPCCGKPTSTVHSYRLRKIQCTEWLGHHTTLILKTRHMVCTNKDCGKKFFAEPLAMTHPYGRHTHEVEERIRHEALCQTARKASETLAMQHIQISASACIRVLRLLGRVNPEVRTSGFVGLDDFAKWKGHKYMCVIVDHYTREVLAVFDSRYGQEITDWLKSIRPLPPDAGTEERCRGAHQGPAGTEKAEYGLSLSVGGRGIQIYPGRHL